MGVTHVVFLQFKPTVDAGTIENVCSRFLGLKDLCLHPLTHKPYILSVRGGVDQSIERLQNGFTHAFVFEFANTEDRDYYVRSESGHREVTMDIMEKTENGAVLDFTDGIL